MKSRLLTLAFALLAPFSTARAASVAVVDSGTDFEHDALAGLELINPNEIAGNRVDDDRNGKVDDLVGWNFVDSYNRVFYREHIASFNPIVYDVLGILGRRQAGQPLPGDQAFWDKHVAGLSDERKQALISHINAYAQYSHGTHVAGIVAAHANDARILSARVFADEPPSEYVAPTHLLSPLAEPFLGPVAGRKGAGGGWTNVVYKILAAINSGVFDQVAVYLNEREIDVANYSLGVPLQVIAKSMLAAKGIKEPTPELLSEETKRAFAKFEPYGQNWMAKASNTLFVVAAGNNGTDNDQLPTFPSNVEMPNSIRVAASLGYSALAEFSCYGATSVDLAAPGVGIGSSVPSADNRMILPMSGTSMAAPMVAGVASRIKDLNPRLAPADIKAILMGTVDKKPWLKGKVVSGGVVNPERAYAAARGSAALSLADAVAAARASVQDVLVNTSAQPPDSSFSVDNLLDIDGTNDFTRRLVF